MRRTWAAVRVLRTFRDDPYRDGRRGLLNHFSLKPLRFPETFIDCRNLRHTCCIPSTRLDELTPKPEAEATLAEFSCSRHQNCPAPRIIPAAGYGTPVASRNRPASPG